MTKRDKATIFSVILLAVLVIAAAVIAIIRSNAEGSLDTASILLYGCIIAAAVLSAIIAFLLKIRKGKHEKQLTPDYYRDYEVIRDTVNSSQLGMGQKNEIRNDILDILISAQESGKSSEDAVGNPEEFAKEILRSYSKPGYLTALGLIDAAITFIVIILGVTVFRWIEEPDANLFNIGIGTDILLFFVIIALVVVPLTRHRLTTRSSWAYFIPIASALVFIGVTMVLREWFSDVDWLRSLLDGSIRMIPNPYLFAVYTLAVILLLLLKYQLRKHMIGQSRE